ncbi:sodium/calcium exchanger Calx isoform X2 [Plodia interpunctella]|uniref:sodium/calcium exchanger Calx isoform X2 n=1 Tax=Plodia interpunctella TaxID=58824 RepID=UPI0023681063|nr:sodium/calcium exchanger 1 isoform X2 [Plodia interpunctella]
MRPALAALAACCVVARAELPSARLAPRNTTPQHVLQCSEGLVLPTWKPLEDVPTLDIALRGVVYFLALMYLFIGVSIVSDRFMAAIEVITSREKEVRVRRNGSDQIIVVRVWNETVANLTLMALGSSAPEILLSVIEIAGKNFEAGDLGPGTIVGSAAYNLFVIMAICVVVIPDGEVRKIKHLRVFLVTATWSIFAYVWLYLILAVISPSEVEVWEGAVTFLFFPATVLTAYIADRRLLVYKYLKKGYRVNERGVIVEAEGDGSVEMALKPNSTDDFASDDEEGREIEKSRKEYVSVLRELRRQHPEEDLETVERMALETLMSRGPKSRAFYRVAATRKMTGGGDFSRKISERAQSDLSEVKAELQRRESGSPSIEPKGPNVRFDPDHYTVMENCGSFEVRVVRAGDLNGEISVQYTTEDGTAEAGSDYVATQGALFFKQGETEKTFTVQVIDDDVFEEDEHFYVRLSSPKGACLASPSTATVVILDDDHSGVFSFPQRDFELTESVGTYDLRVVRTAGARGKVRVPFWTEDGTAKSGLQYEAAQGHILFENNETEKMIPLHIIEEDSYEKDVLFYVNLGDPELLGEVFETYLPDASARLSVQFSPVTHLATLPEEEAVVAMMGLPRAGDITRAQLRVKESKEFKNTVDKLVQRANASIIIGTSSWKEQFTEALTASSGSDDPDEPPSWSDYVLHVVTLFWKILFALIPPTDIGGGYVCFVVSIICIGLVTAVIGDVASHFGCTLGIKDSVTAIVFVALGTSIPDTFASKVAACQDKYADASVGNVTGSNAVNVFLGIGVAWTVAAIVHWSKNEKFLVDPGNLAFSVTMFCSEAALAVLVLVLRRRKSIGGELGGPRVVKIITSMFFFSLWLIYLTMSSLEAYDVIQGF